MKAKTILTAKANNTDQVIIKTRTILRSRLTASPLRNRMITQLLPRHQLTRLSTKSSQLIMNQLFPRMPKATSLRQKIRRSKQQKLKMRLSILLRRKFKRILQHLEALSNRAKNKRMFRRRSSKLRYLNTLCIRTKKSRQKQVEKAKISQVTTSLQLPMMFRQKVRASHQHRLQQSRLRRVVLRQLIRRRQRGKTGLCRVRMTAMKKLAMQQKLKIAQLPGKMKKLRWTRRKLLVKNKRRLWLPPKTRLLIAAKLLKRLWRNKAPRQQNSPQLQMM